MRAAVRAAVPRSIVLDTKCDRPAWEGGSNSLPARIDAWMVTAGVVGDCFAITTAPLGSTARAGARPRWRAVVIRRPVAAQSGRRCVSPAPGGGRQPPRPGQE